MSSTTGSRPLPLELVLASAGTGKTFHISSRIIGLLAVGQPPESIFAATFTRKAAGEITDRVLVRLAAAALDDDAARELSTHALDSMPGSDPATGGLGREDWAGLLRTITRDLHRLEIGTLDSYFVRAALGFSHELELPPGWAISDEATAKRLQADALQDVLAHADRGAVVEMVRGLGRDSAQRSVHDRVLGSVQELLGLYHELDPAAAAEAWSAFDALAAGGSSDIDPADLAKRMRSENVPETKAGAPRKTWQKVVEKIAGCIAVGDWDGACGETLFKRALESDPLAPRFDGVDISPEWSRLLGEAAVLARRNHARRLSMQSHALGRLAARYAEALARQQRAAGGYGFGDLTRALGGPSPVAMRPDLFYRLDARTLHILLDEFQDTSRPQWEALEALVDELLESANGQRAAIVVADPKQSIYGWRGGEPRLVDIVGERYPLATVELGRSFRSSQVVLDLANRVFADLPGNRVLQDLDAGPELAERWQQKFVEHEPAQALPGYLRIEAGPKHERGAPPEFWARAAELVAELWRGSPGASIGVLAATNAVVARVMFELRELGVLASEEGGNPLTDSPAVASLLALLRLADHPGCAVSRYHVAKTPSGRIVAMTDSADQPAARHAAQQVRRRLLDDGYGQTLTAFAAKIATDCNARDWRRVQQLAELGFRYDERATLRTSDFIRLVESERVEDPVAAPVRVMTVHQAKGLEFDIVVLPQLDRSLCPTTPSFHGYRPTPAARLTRIFPHLSKDLQPLFAELHEFRQAIHQSADAALQDAVGSLYVSLTRARHAVHILIGADGEKGMGSAKSGANLVRYALGLTEPTADGEVLFEHGDRDWHRAMRAASPPAAPAPAAGEAAAPPGARGGVPVGVLLRASPQRRRGLPRVRPSDLARGDGLVDLRALLRLGRGAADRGTLAHAWLEQIGWLKDGVPGDDDLRAAAAAAGTTLSLAEIDALIADFRRWLAAPQIARALSRASYGGDATLEREHPFLHREGDALVEGIIDRLVLLRDARGAVTGAEILDYKSDAVDPGDPDAPGLLVARYRPQLEAYRRAIHAAYYIPLPEVRARLVVLAAGRVVDV